METDRPGSASLSRRPSLHTGLKRELISILSDMEAHPVLELIDRAIHLLPAHRAVGIMHWGSNSKRDVAWAVQRGRRWMVIKILDRDSRIERLELPGGTHFKLREPIPLTLECVACGREYVPRFISGHPKQQRFCSDACRKEYWTSSD